MKAAIFHGPGKEATFENVEVDQPRGREVLIQTAASGVCHSDLHFYEGLYPHPAPAILGHEGAGVIEAVGPDVTDFQPGDHVIVCTSIFCGQCERCLQGRPALCMRSQAGLDRGRDDPPKYTLNGEPIAQFAHLSTYAEQMLVHETAAVKIRDDMPLDKAALIGCGVTTGVGAALNTAKIAPGSSVAVFGCGGVGISVVQGAYIAGARQVIAVDTVEHKLAGAKQFGATHTVDATAGDPVQQIKDLTDGEGVDYAFEAIGLKVTAEQCFDVIKRGGLAVVIGMVPVGQTLDLEGREFLSEKKIMGSTMGSNRFRINMPQYIDLYMQGRLKLDEMVSRTGKLEDLNEAFRAMKAGEVTRTVLQF